MTDRLKILEGKLIFTNIIVQLFPRNMHVTKLEKWKKYDISKKSKEIGWKLPETVLILKPEMTLANTNLNNRFPAKCRLKRNSVVLLL